MKHLEGWTAGRNTSSSYDQAEQYIGRKADKNRKICNGMLKTYFYQFIGPKPQAEGTADMKNKLPAGLLLFSLMLMLSVPVPGAQTYYDARLLGKAPVVRSQGRFGTCWALTAVSALEAALLPQKHEIFSPDHMSLQNSFCDQPGGGR